MQNLAWCAPGVVSLLVVAVALTRVDAAFAGRAFAVYGGICIVSSLVRMAGVERTAIILYGVSARP